MLQNPIIHRELIATLRSPRALVFQLLLVILLSCLVLLRWPSSGLVQSGGQGAGQQAQAVLSVFGYGLLGAMILMAPAFPSVSIVKEKVKGTLPLLLNSPLSPLSIFAGKFLASMGFISILLVLSLPLAVACFTMGGVRRLDILQLYLVLFFLGAQYSALALWVSSRSDAVDGALRQTYGLVLALAVFTLAPKLFLAGLFGESLGAYLVNISEWVQAISPLPAVAEALGSADLFSRGLQSGASQPIRFLLISPIITVLVGGLTILRLSGRMLDKPRAQGQVTDEMSDSTQTMRRILYLWFFDPQRRSGLISPLTNAVMIKEFRCRKFGRSGWMIRLIAGALLVSLLLMLAAANSTALFVSKRAEGISQLGSIVVLLQMTLIVFLTPSLASSLISSERESRGWQLLQATPLSAFTIVLGKLMSAAVVLLLILVATLPAYGVLMWGDLSESLRISDVIVTLILAALMALFISATVSSLFAKTAIATTVSYGVLIAIYAGTMLFWLAEESPFSRSFVERVLAINPLAAALQIIGNSDFRHYELLPVNWWAMGAICLISVIILTVQTWRLTRPQ